MSYEASDEHLHHASYIKTVHRNLREESQKIGFDLAWKKHCNEHDILGQYAVSMSTLATQHWNVNASTTNYSECRINWVYRQCIKYFLEGGKKKHRLFELHKLSAFKSLDVTNCREESDEISEDKSLKLLDVGSCYNPFSKFSLFEVLPIDIAPGDPAVVKFDFLKCTVVEENQYSTSSDDQRLSKNFFDVVVFSLLLEYFPCPQSRFDCCKKAFEILKPEGLLFIITPDSKHATANSKIMKKWRIALTSLGFWRVSYEKLKHLRCMAFCKTQHTIFSKLWAEREWKKSNLTVELLNPSDLMIIPQDINSSGVRGALDKVEQIAKDPQSTKMLFEELPSL